MQPTPVTSAGKLLGSFGYGKALIVSLITLGIICVGLAAFVGYLSTIVSTDVSGPVDLQTRRGTTLHFSGPIQIFYFTIGLLLALGLSMFGLALWQKKLRGARYEVYEKGLCQVIGSERDYLPFSEMEDLYLFASGQTAAAGLVNNLAYRRNDSEAFRRVNAHLKGLYKFIDLVRELHLNERLPQAMATLSQGGTVQFNYIGTGQVWGKRVSGNFLNVTTKPLRVTRDALEVEGIKVPMTSLRSIDLSAWTELVVIKDESGRTVLSTAGSGIMSFDLFLNTLHNLLEAKQASATA
ncbi:hypothetical protein H4C80_08480 [Pseudomonas juntendi]|uniref:Uncharacterized protein n=1 Tax=Pseudomonas juntendi TaxID=2666183 RepID=A0A7W2Q8F8_9PSED|nr:MULTISPECIES: hypothetical protein [Pseudomonas]MBA6097153.1 hypothetical protein [Pseudomonas juntendi]WBM31680.1 hypothetical protein M2J80_19350 [Pseudomonas sp. NY11382]